ncbi:protein THEM6 [Cloeon dipterum]|uniref:protein THEM6 n=1 Tax=Cloeon dipterum TaxID=197152 RepID=UPI00321F6236
MISLIGIVAFLFIFLDANYFIRIAFTILFGRVFQTKKKPTDQTAIYGFCTTQDVDIFVRHMNNARYVREMDFARFHFYDRTGLYESIVENKGNALQGACNIRYRRTIPIFTPYKVVTKLAGWDEKSIYLEQHFVTLSDGFIRAVALSKQNIVGVNVNQMLKDYPKPQQTLDLTQWLQSIETSSERLRKDK